MIRTLGISALWLSVAHSLTAAENNVEPAERPAVSPDETLLESKGIEPTAEGLRSYLRGLKPSDEQRRAVAKLIEQLGSTESFAAREVAMGRLIALPSPPREALVAAVAGADPEIRWRAQRVLAAGGGESQRILHAAFRLIEQKRIAGLIEELLESIPACDQPYLASAALKAVRATTAQSDAKLLHAALQHEHAGVRAAAVAGCHAALGKQAVQDLSPLLKDDQERVRVEAARALAAVGDRGALIVLADLLKSADAGVRFAAFAALRDAAGAELGYNAFSPADQRDAAAENWAAWAAEDGQTAKLKPVKPLGINDGYLQQGATLEGGFQIAATGYFRDNLYVIVLQPAGMNWSTANDVAVKLGGHLACIGDADEDAFIVKLNQSTGTNTPWIGLTDAEVEGQWKWVTGEKVSYTNWAPNEPNNLGDEDAAQVHPHGTWNDVNVNGLVVACAVEIPR
jgi:hypothetical protein